MRVFIGYDEREEAAAIVSLSSLRESTRGARMDAEYINAEKLSAQGLLSRVSDHRGGQDYDLVSNAPKSTRFAVSRFLTPILCQNGYALFVDADTVFLEDPRVLLNEVERGKPVYVVKHDYQPSSAYKMVNQKNAGYSRKNWSSVMLFDCDHIANRRLSLRDVNERRGIELHQFYWLHDDEIGSLNPRWNWLVGEEKKPESVGIAHFTLGGPWLDGWKGAEHDDIWLAAAGTKRMAA